MRVFCLAKDDFKRLTKLYPMDEGEVDLWRGSGLGSSGEGLRVVVDAVSPPLDVIFHNLTTLSSETEKVETGSKAASTHSSLHSFESGFKSMVDEEVFEKAMDDIAKAKTKSREQRIRVFCNAALLGNTEAMSRLISSGVNINDVDANGR